jgi:hypothetical protein
MSAMTSSRDLAVPSPTGQRERIRGKEARRERGTPINPDAHADICDLKKVSVARLPRLM